MIKEIFDSFSMEDRKEISKYSWDFLFWTVLFAFFGLAVMFSVYLPQVFHNFQKMSIEDPMVFGALISLSIVVVLFVICLFWVNKITKLNGNRSFRISLVGLSIFSVVLVGWAFFNPPAIYAESILLLKHIYSFVLGFALFFYVSDLPLRKMKNIRPGVVIVFVIFMLFIQLLPLFFGDKINGAHRRVGIQVSELLVPTMIFYFSWVGVRQNELNPTWRWIFVLLFLVPAFLLVFFAQNNLSTALLYLVMGLIMLWRCDILVFDELPSLNKIPNNKIISFVVINILSVNKIMPSVNWIILLIKKYTVISVVLFLSLCAILMTASADFREHRVKDWLKYDFDPRLISPKMSDFDSYRNKDGAQPVNARIAIIRGGWLGVGPGKSPENNKKKIKEAVNDYIFSVMCSEWGLVVMFVICSLAAYKIIYFYQFCASPRFKAERKELNNEDEFLKKLSTGVYVYISMQILAHIYVNLSLLPVTGIPLPLFSRGGTSLVMTFAMLGIIFNMTKKRRMS